MRNRYHRVYLCQSCCTVVLKKDVDLNFSLCFLLGGLIGNTVFRLFQILFSQTPNSSKIQHCHL